jgi:hypothetical protein
MFGKFLETLPTCVEVSVQVKYGTTLIFLPYMEYKLYSNCALT